MEQGLPKREDYHRNSVDHIIGTDGIFTAKELIVGGLVISVSVCHGVELVCFADGSLGN